MSRKGPCRADSSRNVPQKKRKKNGKQKMPQHSSDFGSAELAFASCRLLLIPAHLKSKGIFQVSPEYHWENSPCHAIGIQVSWPKIGWDKPGGGFRFGTSGGQAGRHRARRAVQLESLNLANAGSHLEPKVACPGKEDQSGN